MISSRKRLIYQMLQMLRVRGFLVGMAAFVLAPTIIATYYYTFVASDIYVSKSKYAIDVDSEEMVSSILPMLTGGGSSKKDKALLTREYIQSRTLLGTLEKKLNLRKIYEHDAADSFQRLAKDASEEAYVNYYNDMVELTIDEEANITHLSVKAFTPQDAQQINKAILEHAEHYVNELSARMQIDSLIFARMQVEDAQGGVIEASQAITRFRNAYQQVDPTQRSGGVFNIIQQLENSLALRRADLAEYQDYMQEDSPKIASLRARIAALEQEVIEQNTRLTGDEEIKLAELSEEYEALQLEREFATKRYELALQNLEVAQISAQKKRIYLLRIVEPTAPDVSTEPKRLLRILEVLLVSLVAYLILALIIEAVGDHIKPKRRN